MPDAKDVVSLGTCPNCGAYHGSWEPCHPSAQLVRRLVERVRVLDNVVVEHHSASIMREEHHICPVCEAHGGVTFFEENAALYRVPASPPPAVTGEAMNTPARAGSGVESWPAPSSTGAAADAMTDEEHARRAAIALLLDYDYVLMTQAKYDAHMAEVLRLRSSPVAADVALREAAEYVIYCYDGGLLAPQESNAISRLRAALSRVPSSVAASGGEP